MYTLRYPGIASDLRYPIRCPSEGHDNHGVMVARSTKLAEPGYFEEVKRKQENYSCIWFKFHDSVFGGLYLLPNMELITCIEYVINRGIRGYTGRWSTFVSSGGSNRKSRVDHYKHTLGLRAVAICP